MVQFYQSAFPQALGWSLIDSLWQMGLLWSFYTLITLNGRKATAGQRFNLAFLFTGIGASLFFFNLIFYSLYPEQHGIFYSLSVALTNIVAEKFSGFENPFFVSAISFVYLILLSAYITKLLLSPKIAILKREIREKNSNPLLETLLQQVSDRLGIIRKVGLKLSDRIVSPFTTGFLKPVIFLPFGVVGQLSLSEIETIIAHELFHVKRNDYLANFLLIVSEVIFFFNPFARMLISTCKKEREHACDDLVLAAGYDRMVYANVLLTLGQFSVDQPAMPLSAIAATGNSDRLLLQRINRIFKLGAVRKGWLRPLVLFFLCLFVTLFVKAPKTAAPILAGKPAANATPVYASVVVLQVRQATIAEAAVAQPAGGRAVAKPVKKCESPRPRKPAPPAAPGEKVPDPPEAPLPVIAVHRKVTGIAEPGHLYINARIPQPEYSLRLSMADPGAATAEPLLVPYVANASFYYPEFEPNKHVKTRRIIHL